MKATHNKASEGEVEWKFPCLGLAYDGSVIVLFKERECGTTILHPTKSIGYYSDKWDMTLFTPLPSTESVTLQND
jgi:hypothetical protein